MLVAAAPASAAALGARVIGRGDRGGDVATLQRVLAMKGYAVGAPDGVFGPLTKRAVKSFQRAAGLTPDGRVGPATTSGLARNWGLHTATFYGPGLWGNRTACGYVLRRGTRGVAHRTLPCGTPVAVYVNGRIAVYPVIDRGPHSAAASLDLTQAEARDLGMSTTTTVRAGW